MNGEYLNAYQSLFKDSERITATKISKVSYLLKLKAQEISISELDNKHKAWGNQQIISK